MNLENLFFHHAATESLYTAMMSPVYEKYGLTYMEFTVLMFLANNPRFDTASDIVKYRRLTKSHVSLSIRGLDRKGLLKGAHHAFNRKTIHLTVLEKADAIVAEGREAQQAFGRILFAGFSDSEREELAALLMRINQNIAEHTEAAQSRQGV